jgi:hypothetical protein
VQILLSLSGIFLDITKWHVGKFIARSLVTSTFVYSYLQVCNNLNNYKFYKIHILRKKTNSEITALKLVSTIFNKFH